MKTDAIERMEPVAFECIRHVDGTWGAIVTMGKPRVFAEGCPTIPAAIESLNAKLDEREKIQKGEPT